LDSLTRFAAAKPEKKKAYRWEENIRIIGVE